MVHGAWGGGKAGRDGTLNVTANVPRGWLGVPASDSLLWCTVVAKTDYAFFSQACIFYTY